MDLSCSRQPGKSEKKQSKKNLCLNFRDLDIYIYILFLGAGDIIIYIFYILTNNGIFVIMPLFRQLFRPVCCMSIWVIFREIRTEEFPAVS